ncbi:hypothetical protein ACFOU2_06320 [Bacillus songklensis]|uniref:Uncharacterized protein n=1 Tax=Bacillus songklensis TaxID=1069116 RepID=A0ABV8AYV8_9BACI
MFVRKTRSYKDNYPNSIAAFEKVQLGGLEQTILIRGENRDNPILLFLQ